jgi:hypothetical protein
MHRAFKVELTTITYHWRIRERSLLSGKMDAQRPGKVHNRREIAARNSVDAR